MWVSLYHRPWPSILADARPHSLPSSPRSPSPTQTPESAPMLYSHVPTCTYCLLSFPTARLGSPNTANFSLLFDIFQCRSTLHYCLRYALASICFHRRCRRVNLQPSLSEHRAVSTLSFVPGKQQDQANRRACRASAQCQRLAAQNRKCYCVYDPSGVPQALFAFVVLQPWAILHPQRLDAVRPPTVCRSKGV